MVGAINLHKGLSPSSQRPCWAHNKNSPVMSRAVLLLGNLLHKNRIRKTERRKELEQKSLGVDLRLVQDAVFHGGFEDLLLGGLARS